MASKWAPCLALSCLLGIGGIPAASAQDATPIPTSALTPVVIDSDMISDDWMAVLFVLNDPAFSVKALTVPGTGFAADCEAVPPVRVSLVNALGRLVAAAVR